MPAGYLWGWDAANWKKVLVDLAGHLQVDVITAGSTVGHCYGWTGAAWTPLLVESLASANLRTRLYDGVNPVVSVGTAADIADANRGLFTQAGVRGWDGTFWKSVNVEDDAGDALVNARASLSVVSKLYGYNGVTWDRLIVQNDVAHNLRVKLYDGVNGIDSRYFNAGGSAVNLLLGQMVVSQTMLQYSATHAVPQRASYFITDGEGGAHQPSVSLAGYNGATYDRLRVESNVAFNLRVKLYDGANGIDSALGSASTIPEANRGLIVSSLLYLNDSLATLWRTWQNAFSIPDGGPGATMPAVALYGWNGASFDRLRTYGTGILKVGRAEIDSTTIRKTVAGAVVAGAHNVYWIACSPDGPGSEFELTDAIAGGGAVVFDHFDPDKHSEVIHLDPPMKFATGIWIEKFDHIKSLVFCYI